MPEEVTSGALASPRRGRGQAKGAGLIPGNRTWRFRPWSQSSRIFLLAFSRAAQGFFRWRCGSEGRQPSTGEETAGGRLGPFVRSERLRGLAGSGRTSMSLRIPVAEAEQTLRQTILLPLPPPGGAQAGERARHRCGDIVARPGPGALRVGPSRNPGRCRSHLQSSPKAGVGRASFTPPLPPPPAVSAPRGVTRNRGSGKKGLGGEDEANLSWRERGERAP